MRPGADRTIGVVGTGRMGLGLCGRLAARGYEVAATDADRGARPGVTALGARWVSDIAALAGCGRVLTALPGPDEVQAVRPQLLAALPAGSTWVDMSTSTPAVARANATHADRHHIHFLEAAMGGGPAEARAGTLTLFVGGAEADLAGQRDLISALSARVLHVGGTGSGCAMKLLANLLWFGQAVAGAEALALAARAGLDPERVRDALSHSAGSSRFMQAEARSLLAGDDLASFSLAGCLTELEAVMALGRELDVPLGVAERVTELYGDALARYGDVDGELLAARLVLERADARLSGRAS